MKIYSKLVLIGSLAGALLAAPCRAANWDDNPRTVYFTVGDSQMMPWTPLESQESIDAVFDALAKHDHVARVWWRGGQDEVWGEEFLIREQNREYSRIWDWWRDLQYRVVGTNKIAVKAAHERGMEIWMAYGLFDNGSSADAAFYGFPYGVEDRIRVEHPEWAPVNRFGTWKQGGPIEFCYPGARKAMVDYLTKYVVEGNYDGIAFLSYVENYTQRYEDEFGYNQPIVDEFQKRFGVDIRTQPFDRVAWAKLRGEYLTQFFRELHQSLAKSGKKIAMCVDGKYPYWPCRWGGVETGVRTSGKVWLDVETWTKEGIVDEISLFKPIDDPSLKKGLALCANTSTKLSSWGSRDELPTGVSRIMTIGAELESGFDWENWIDWPDEIVPAQPKEALHSSDVDARRRILTAIQKKIQKASVAEVAPLVKDPDVLIRRSALRALGAMKDPAALPAVKSAMSDPANSVRWQAAIVLAELAPTTCLPDLFAAVANSNSTYQYNFAIMPEILKSLKTQGALTPESIKFLTERGADADPKVRETAWYSLQTLVPPVTDQLGQAAVTALKNDSSPYVREMVLNVMNHFDPKPAYVDAVYSCISHDRDVVVQVWACKTLGSLASKDPALRPKALKTLTGIFRQYGEGSRRTDQEWGWRVVGNTLNDFFGADGRAVLDQFMQQKEDRALADLAWRVVYLQQEDGRTPGHEKIASVNEAQDWEAHQKHPFLKFKMNEAAASFLPTVK